MDGALERAQRGKRRLPVRFDHGPADAVSEAVIDPPNVLVRGPQEVLDRLSSIAAQPCSLPGPPEGTTAETVVLGPVPLADDAGQDSTQPSATHQGVLELPGLGRVPCDRLPTGEPVFDLEVLEQLIGRDATEEKR